MEAFLFLSVPQYELAILNNTNIATDAIKEMIEAVCNSETGFMKSVQMLIITLGS